MSARTWCGLSISRAAAAALFIAAAQVQFVQHAFAEEHAQTAVFSEVTSRQALLEDAFWRCDYAATTRGIEATPLEFCSAVYDAVKDEKFSGSFEDLLGWWAENKQRMHLELEGQ